ncbi:MAG: hypothetical protein ACLPKT_20760 [Methylocella sp.]
MKQDTATNQVHHTVRFDRAIRAAIREKLALNGNTEQLAAEQANKGQAEQRHWFRRSLRYVELFLLRSPIRALRRVLHNDLRKDIAQVAAAIERTDALAEISRREMAAAVERTYALVEASRGEVTAAIAELRARTPIEVDDSTLAVRTADGFVFEPRSDTMLLLMLYDAGPQGLEPGTRRLLIRLSAPGMMFVDVGAHVGLLTLAGARAVGPIDELSGECRRVHQQDLAAVEPVNILFCRPNSQAARRARS